MDTTYVTLACYLLVCTFALAQNDQENVTPASTFSIPSLNLTDTTALPSPHNSTAQATDVSNSTATTTAFESTGQDSNTSTTTMAATSEIGHPETTQASTITTPLSHTSLMTATPEITAATVTALTTLDRQSIGSYRTPTDTTVMTANSSETVNTTSESKHRTTHDFGLNTSETFLTALFSVVLGVFAMAPFVFLLNKCKHKSQYFHQPLTNTADADPIVPDEDTLVISGGLYDGHPIYDHVPTGQEQQSQFRLEFLY